MLRFFLTKVPDMFHNDCPKVHYLKDYQPPTYLVDKVHLRFDLRDDVTVVTNEMSVRRNPKLPPEEANPPFILDGEELDLLSVELNGVKLESSQYKAKRSLLTIHEVTEQFTLTIVTEIYPQENKKLEGLYKSRQLFCTQCESHGFRHITFYPDRPDVLARFTTTIEADRQYPILLSNGNRISQQNLDNNRHQVVFEDPFPKPSYLFALVAGDLKCVRDSFTTQSGRSVSLEIYVEAGNETKCAHAMKSLKAAMRWDEENFNREYDLDTYMIVAVNDFNQGAMENKGLNIFNDKYILADPQTATDTDYENIEAVVAHEYFHNYSGNRVTLRDWFQLSLKEGLTVYREQRFCEDVQSAAVRRIGQIKLLKDAQFAEDAGPLSHPVKPEQYIEMNNFYTVTVYEKGAEIIRMINTFIGDKNFRLGMDLYFTQYDGQAVTTDEFVDAMSQVSGMDLTQFKKWYSQSGTPVIEVSSYHDSDVGLFMITVTQHNPATADQQTKEPLSIPFNVALLNDDGKAVALDETGRKSKTLTVNKPRQTFCLKNISETVTPSYLRSFSAPVKLSHDLHVDDLLFIAAHETCAVSRYEAASAIIFKAILLSYRHATNGKPLVYPQLLKDYFSQVLTEEQTDYAFAALLIELPSLACLSTKVEVINIDVLHEVHQFLIQETAKHFYESFMDYYRRLAVKSTYSITPEAIGKRAFKNACLQYLIATPTNDSVDLAYTQFQQANNMTDTLAALKALSNTTHDKTHQALGQFYKKWQNNALVIDKWFTIIAASPVLGTLDKMKDLTKDKAFSLRNPNRVSALFGSFAKHNLFQFHQGQSRSYDFVAHYIVTLNTLNPMVSARLLQAFANWSKYTEPYKSAMRQTLDDIEQTRNLSKNNRELIDKILGI